MRRTNSGRGKASPHGAEGGQAAFYLTLILGVFLLGAVALAVDLANLWFHRQAAQNAADAACTAAAMDMVNNSSSGTLSGGFDPAGGTFRCSQNSAASPCQYAAFNGYTATGLTPSIPSTEVEIGFPSSVPGVRSCNSTPAPSVCTVAGFPSHPFVRATVTDRMQTFFIGLVGGGRTIDAGATATCGALLANAPIPILVLNPSVSGSLSTNGNFNITIVGGPQKSIQVDSTSASAVSVSGIPGTFDLHLGGPNVPPTGSDFGVTGIESQPSGTYLFGSAGGWRSPTPSISDPFATITAPSSTGLPVGTVTFAQKTFPECSDGTCGCPDLIHGCDHYHPGTYTSGIRINPPATSATGLAIFDPGIYYISGGDLDARSNSCLRPSTATGDGSGGTLFYFSGLSTINVTAASGTLVLKTGSVTNFDCQSSTYKVPLSQVQCIQSGPGATILPGNIVAAGGLIGNVLLGPCQAPTSGTTNYGDPLGTNDPLGEQRGMLFFQDRSANLAAATPAKQPTWQGSGSFGLAGMMYFHYCASATPGAGTGCDTVNGFTDQFSLGGGSSSSTFVVGDIVVDQLYLNGNPQIQMDLNPNALYYVLKASLIQ